MLAETKQSNLSGKDASRCQQDDYILLIRVENHGHLGVNEPSHLMSLMRMFLNSTHIGFPA